MIGETLGSYRIISQLGAGAMGEVYLAEHRHLKRKAALKLLARELVGRPDLLERFFLEARATSAIAHPGIVQIFDCEVDATGRPYIVMEYLAGETVAARLARSRPLPAPTVARLVRGMAQALDAAHAKGIVHRDIKPENIFVEAEPPESIKLVDFGIAKLAGEFRSGQVHQTRTGSLMGTPLYMSPEQCRDSASIDFRTDLYSLGCVMFEMLTGQPPFAREALGDLVVAHLTEQPADVRTLNPSVPTALAELCAALLQKDPAARPANMRQVADRLDRFIGSATTVPAPPPAAVTDGAPAVPAKTTLRDSAAEIVASLEAPVVAPKPWSRIAMGGIAVVIVLGAGSRMLMLRRGRPSSTDAPVTASSPHVRAGGPGSDVTVSAPVPAPSPAPSPSGPVVRAGSDRAPAAPAGGNNQVRRIGVASAKAKGPAGSSGSLAMKSGAAVHAGAGPAAAAPPESANEAAHVPLTGAWEGPWHDPGKQQKGRLYLQIGGDDTVSGWMFNTAAQQSFPLTGRMAAGGGVTLVCQCPVDQAFTAHGTIHVNSDGELKGQLSLSSGAGVFGQSHLTLRRTTPR